MSTLLNRTQGYDRQADPAVEPASARRRRGAVLVLGAIVLLVSAKPIGPLDYVWVPVLTGLAFLLAAVAGGRRSALWGPGLLITAWGAGQVISTHANDSANMGGMSHRVSGMSQMGGMAHGGQQWHWSGALVYLLLGAAAILAAWLATRGFGVSLFSVGAAIAFIGAGIFIHSNYSSTLTAAMCALTGGWGLWELLRPARRGAPAETAAA
ncbi:MAG: hypothetical protein M3042_01270 [Actinomycetota bacterium]|nr:hypothetical protein [Actinomycetota bacterium]